MLVDVHKLSWFANFHRGTDLLLFEGAVSGLLAALTQIYETVNGTLTGRAMHNYWALLVF